jgi:FSR family fosmidomycin resistance protein-like MFS transporter
MMLPYADLTWTGILSAIIGMVLASAFSAIIVYAQDLLPGKVGTVAGLFFGLAFGLAGLAAAVIGNFADTYGIDAVYRCLAFLPALGILTVMLPDLHRRKAADPAKAV